MTESDDLARRAQEIAARAARLAEDANDSDALRDELDRLDRELASLEEEQQRLDAELGARGEEAATDAGRRPRTGWFDVVDDVLATVRRFGGRAGAVGWRATDTIERSVAVDGPVPVVVKSMAGSVNVQAGQGGVVQATAERFAASRAVLDDIALDVRHEDGRVLVDCSWPEPRRGRSVRLTVHVPEGSPIEADTLGGAVRVRGTRGPAALTTKGGSVSAEQTTGALTLRTSGGGVHAEDHDGAVDASTMGGSIHLQGRLTGTVAARTMGGSVFIDGVDHAQVNVSTAGGSIRVRGALRGTSSIRTAGGSVALTIPGDNHLQVDGKGSNVSSDFPELHLARNRVHGVLGDGSDGSVDLRTSGGAVSVNKT